MITLTLTEEELHLVIQGLLEPRVWVLVKDGRLLAAGFTKSEVEKVMTERKAIALTATEYLEGRY